MNMKYNFRGRKYRRRISQMKDVNKHEGVNGVFFQLKAMMPYYCQN